MFDNLTNALPQVRDGRVRALAVAGERRISELPDVPAIAEFYPDGVASVRLVNQTAYL